jgi:lipopolysaccharide export system protein LptA
VPIIMRSFSMAFQGLAVALTPVVLALGLVEPVAAEKADRTKPMVIEADKPGTMDLQRQVVVFNGNVAIAQGTMSLRAERIEVREAKNGDRFAAVIGEPGKPATYRQKRDADQEWIEGSAERIEYDARSDTLKFSGQASVRFLRGTEITDEVSGDSILWNNSAGQVSVAGGMPSSSNPSGRIRAVLSPRAEAPTSTSSAAPEGPPLKPSRTLGGASQ